MATDAHGAPASPASSAHTEHFHGTEMGGAPWGGEVGWYFPPDGGDEGVVEFGAVPHPDEYLQQELAEAAATEDYMDGVSRDGAKRTRAIMEMRDWLRGGLTKEELMQDRMLAIMIRDTGHEDRGGASGTNEWEPADTGGASGSGGATGSGSPLMPIAPAIGSATASPSAKNPKSKDYEANRDKFSRPSAPPPVAHVSGGSALPDMDAAARRPVRLPFRARISTPSGSAGSTPSSSNGSAREGPFN